MKGESLLLDIHLFLFCSAAADSEGKTEAATQLESTDDGQEGADSNSSQYDYAY